jgi:predicted AAA+ superfamily ATPase
MNPRFAQSSLARCLSEFPAVVLLGPRQVGKTTLALVEAERRGNALYLDLELPSAQRQLDDPEAFLLAHRNRLVILDEVQRMLPPQGKQRLQRCHWRASPYGGAVV